MHVPLILRQELRSLHWLSRGELFDQLSFQILTRENLCSLQAKADESRDLIKLFSGKGCAQVVTEFIDTKGDALLLGQDNCNITVAQYKKRPELHEEVPVFLVIDTAGSVTLQE